MTLNVYPLDIRDDNDSEVAELSDEELQTVRDKRDSKEWYANHDGWHLAEEQVSDELESMCGTSDLDELDRMLGSEAEADELSDREREIAECKERISFYERHNYGDIIEDEYDRLKALKEGA